MEYLSNLRTLLMKRACVRACMCTRVCVPVLCVHVCAYVYTCVRMCACVLCIQASTNLWDAVSC